MITALRTRHGYIRPVNARTPRASQVQCGADRADLRARPHTPATTIHHVESALGARYVSDEAEPTIAAVVGDIQDRA